MRKNLLDEDEIVNLRETVKALESFNQVSVLLSGDTYATCSLIIPSIKYLEKQLNKKKTDTPALIVQLKSHLLECLQDYKDSYEIENNSFLLCATFLDPNYKTFPFFESYEKKKYMKIVKEFLADFYVTKKISEIIQIEKVTTESKKFKLSFDDADDDSESDTDTFITLDLKKEINEYTRLAVNQQNVLEFWRQNQFTLPILYCISTMILCTPATSAPSERLFSDAQNNLYDKRNRMTADCFQMLMFLYENLEFFNLLNT